MNNATTQIHFAVVDGDLEVSGPLELSSLNDFLETEIGTSEAVLDQIDHHVRHARTWQFTGNACHLRLDGETATIEHAYTDAQTTLARADLRTLLAELRTCTAGYGSSGAVEPSANA